MKGNFAPKNQQLMFNLRRSISQKSKALEERVHLGTRSERVPQNEERGRNETTFFGKKRSKNEKANALFVGNSKLHFNLSNVTSRSIIFPP